MIPLNLFGARILVVDEEPAMVRYISTILDDKGYVFEHAVSGLQAMEQINAGSVPDLVLMAMSLPGQDGIATLEQMHDVVPNLPVVILTDVADTRCVVRAIKAGAYDCLTKPFAPEDLERVVEAGVSTRVSRKPAPSAS